MFSMQFAAALFVIGVCLVSACIDYKKGIIPNYITIPSIFVGITAAFISAGWNGLLVSLASAFATALVPLFLFRFNAMGGGDVKLFAAIGALLGIDQALQIMMISFLFGAGVGIFTWVRNGLLKDKVRYAVQKILPWRWRKHNTASLSGEPTYIRFGPSIFLASVFVIIFFQIEQAGYAVL